MMDPKKRKSLDLNDVLKNQDEIRDNFKKFLDSEWSAENLIFWDEIESLRKIQDPQKVHDQCITIYRKFIEKGCLFELNLSWVIKEELRMHIEENNQNNKKLQLEMYDKPQKAIFELMEGDSFQRFQSSSLFIE